MQSLKSHHKSERWLQALAQQNARLQSPDAREAAAAKHAIRQATDAYLQSKHASSPAQREAGMRKLRDLAVARGLWNVAAAPLPPQGPPPPPKPAGAKSVLKSLGFGALSDLHSHVEGPQGVPLLHKLRRMDRAQRHNDAVEFSHSLIELLYAGLTSHPLNRDTLTTLGRTLEAHLVPYLRSVRQLSDAKAWKRAQPLLYDQQRLGAQAAAYGIGLPQVLYWIPDVVALNHYRAILTMAPEAQTQASPATAKFLRFLLVMEGPAQRFWAHHPVTLELHDVGHSQCACKGQKEHVARSVRKANHELVLVFGPSVDMLVHGEHVPRLGPFLRSAATDIAHGVRRVYAESVRRGNWDLLDDLFAVWKQQACLNGKLDSLGQFLTDMSLDDGLDVLDVPELDNKLSDQDKCGEYLRLFRRLQRRTLAQTYNLDANDVQRIEAHPRFVKDYFNDETFTHYLMGTEFGRRQTPAQLQALLAYQIDTLWVLSRKPRQEPAQATAE